MLIERLNRRFFERDTKLVATDLLGKYLIRETSKGRMVGKVIETEAYLGPKDKASHSYDYKETNRTKTMYMRPGTLYIYLIYGIYYCLNVITEPEGMPCAVLIRQLLPIDGIELMIKNRNVKIRKDNQNLTDGPGKLCMAFNITRDQFNGTDSCDSKSQLFFVKGENVKKESIIVRKRIGIDYAEEDKDQMLRFSLKL